MIRRAKLEDIEEIVLLEEECFKHSLGYDTIKNLIENPMGDVYVIDEDKIIGYISLYYDLEVVEIYNLCISPISRKKGYATGLLERVFSDYSNATSFFLEVRESNVAAISLYTGLGFEKKYVRKNYYETEDALVLIKEK